MELKATFKTLDDREVTYQFTALKRKEAALVFHNTLRTLLSGLAGAGREDGGVDFVEALKGFEFELFWSLAKKLLKFCIVTSDKGVVEIKDLDATDYFEDRWDELYYAVFHAVKENYPKFFSGLMESLGFSLESQEDKSPSQ